MTTSGMNASAILPHSLNFEKLFIKGTRKDNIRQIAVICISSNLICENNLSKLLQHTSVTPV